MAGYCLVNDVSERAFQTERQGQWTKGKSADHFGPTGPWLVTRDEVADPQKLPMWLKVNGQTRQDGSTATMVYGVKFLVAYLSQFMSLNPGDIVSTGTPPGVGMGMKPPTYLKAGDVIELGIEGLGAAAPGLHRRPGLAAMLPLLDTHQHLDLPRPPRLRLDGRRCRRWRGGPSRSRTTRR